MTDAGNYLLIARGWLVLLIGVFLIIKFVLFYIREKDWSVITFFYFNRIQLKLTNNRNLRKSRKQQNLLTQMLVVLFVLFFFSSIFYTLIIK